MRMTMTTTTIKLGMAEHAQFEHACGPPLQDMPGSAEHAQPSALS